MHYLLFYEKAADYEVTKVEQHHSRGRASRPLRNGPLATPSHSPDGEAIREGAASIAAPHVPAADVTGEDWRNCGAHRGMADRSALHW